MFITNVVKLIMSIFFGVKPHQNDQKEISSVQYININGNRMTLIGVLESENSSVFFKLIF